MANKNIGVHVGGPEDRVVSARLDSMLGVVGTLPNPIPFRLVHIQTVNQPVPKVLSISYTTVGLGTNPYGYSDYMTTAVWATLDSTGAEVGRYSGTQFGRTVSVGGGGASMEYTFTNWPLSAGASWYTMSGYTIGSTSGGGSLNTVLPKTPISPGYYDILAGDEAAGVGGVSTVLMASDGEILGRVYVYNWNGYGTGVYPEYFAKNRWYGWGWLGDNWFPVYHLKNADGTQYTIREFLPEGTFAPIPEDCIEPVPPITPSEPYVTVYISVTTTTIAPTTTDPNLPPSRTREVRFAGDTGVIVTRTGSLVYSIAYLEDGSGRFSLTAVYTDWLVEHELVTATQIDHQYVSAPVRVSVFDTPEYASAGTITPEILPFVMAMREARGVALLRRQRWLKKNSDTILSQLADGTFTMSPNWEMTLKRLAPTSLHTYRSTNITVTTTDTVTSDSTAGLTQPGVYTATRTALLRYTVLEGGEHVERTHTIVGTVVRTVTEHNERHALTDGLRRIVSSTYTDWYSETNPSSVSYNAYTNSVQLPRNGGGLSGWESRYLPGIGTVWSGDDVTGFYADSEYYWDGYLVPSYYAGMSVLFFDPPIPRALSTLRGTTPPFIQEYLRVEPIKYDPEVSGATAWNSSLLHDGQTVKVALFGPRGDGIFGRVDELATEIDVFGEASFLYKEGYFTLVGWTPVAAPTSPPEESPPYRTIRCSNDRRYISTNCVLRYSGIKWPDLRATASATNSLLKGLDPSVSTRLAVIAALTAE